MARQRLANRFDMNLPENQRKLEAAGQLGELADKAGITLIEMAIAFVLRHPAVTSAIIGPCCSQPPSRSCSERRLSGRMSVHTSSTKNPCTEISSPSTSRIREMSWIARNGQSDAADDGLHLEVPLPRGAGADLGGTLRGPAPFPAQPLPGSQPR